MKIILFLFDILIKNFLIGCIQVLKEKYQKLSKKHQKMKEKIKNNEEKMAELRKENEELQKKFVFNIILK